MKERTFVYFMTYTYAIPSTGVTSDGFQVQIIFLVHNRFGLDYFLSVRMASEEQTQVFVQNGLTREEKIRKQNCPKLPRHVG